VIQRSFSVSDYCIRFDGASAPTISGNTLNIQGSAIIVGSGAASISGNGITCTGTGLYLGNGAATVSGNTISGAGLGITCQSGCSAVIRTNTVQNAGTAVQVDLNSSLTFQGNSFSGSGFRGLMVSGNIGASQTWSPSILASMGLDPVYWVTDNLTVLNGARLTIQPGTVVKFTKRRSDYEEVRLIVQGELMAVGTAGNKIYFTSIDDPSVGGSGAGGDGTPDSTDWGWIEFQNSSVDANCRLEYCELRYGGNDYYNYGRNEAWVVRCYDASPTIRNCTFNSCRGGVYAVNTSVAITRSYFSGITANSAVYIDGGSSLLQQPLVMANTFSSCAVGVDFAGPTFPSSQANFKGNVFTSDTIGVKITRAGLGLVVNENQFSGTMTYGVQNLDASTRINAQYNWWGAANGPGAPGGTGSGVPITTNINYSGFWTNANQGSTGIRNIIAQRRGTSMVVDISYDLVGTVGKTYTIALAISKTGGTPYNITPIPGSVTGDIGAHIVPGTQKNIVWDSAYGGGGNYTDLMRVQITGNEE